MDPLRKSNLISIRGTTASLRRRIPHGIVPLISYAYDMGFDIFHIFIVFFSVAPFRSLCISQSPSLIQCNLSVIMRYGSRQINEPHRKLILWWRSFANIRHGYVKLVIWPPRLLRWSATGAGNQLRPIHLIDMFYLFVDCASFEHFFFFALASFKTSAWLNQASGICISGSNITEMQKYK